MALVVFMQKNPENPTRLANELKASKPGAVYVEGAPCDGAVELAQDKGLLVYLPEAGLHPADVAKAARNLVKVAAEGVDVHLATHSVTVLYALNNEIAVRGYKDTSVFVVDEDRFVTNHEGWIDESIIGWVTDELSTELNEFLRQKSETAKTA